jgi:hypothetical protein
MPEGCGQRRRKDPEGHRQAQERIRRCDRRKREEKEEKDREEDRKFVRESADAYNFQAGGNGIA